MIRYYHMEYPLRKLTQSEFPPLLLEIPDAPKTLYLRGTLPAPEVKLLAVVGSRKYTPYGKMAVEKLIGGLRGYPIAIVSGLALGIDGLAHLAALSAGLKTIAVPGSGLQDEVLYPSTHHALAKKILAAGGALISEFEPDFKARPESFPQRNRIMAGMSHAVLIVEAANKSGTLITSRLATDYNRDVLVVPGSIFSESSFGPHMLLSLGATPITSSEDILRALTIEVSPSAPHERADISETEKRVLTILTEPRTRDELTDALSLPASEASILLSTMELKGLIAQELGKIHAR